MTPSREELRTWLSQTIDEHSGGLKGTELLVKWIRTFGGESLDPGKFFDELEEVLKSLPEFGLLRYSYKVGDDLYREKTFFYRREPSCEHAKKNHA